MESPVVLDKPPEYYGTATNERGFPFDEEEGSGAWSELAARHPDIAARLRQRPATWARKRRPSSQDGIDDTADSFGGFDRFPFDDIPPEFREHFPSHWNRRFGPREEQYQQPSSPQPHSPQHQTAATQTEQDAEQLQDEQTPLPQYGLRNTVDLGQKSPADPSVVDADERSHRSMSAPPDHRTVNPNSNKMSGQNHQEQQQPHQPEQSSNVRHIPIFVEGRDEPVINKSVDHGTHFAEAKPTYVPPPQPHIDRDQYFADDGPVGFPFAKSFDRPFFRQGPQPFTKQKMYPQAAFNRGASPQRSQSPKPQTYQEQTAPRAETPSRPQQKQAPPQQKQPSPQQRQAPPPQQTPQHPPHNQVPPQAPQTPPQPQAPSANDPITLILSIQTDVLNLMTDVENFKGTKNDKQYLYLDEMLTRNLIKLDNIETDGKENIRQARKEAIKCIQKCIAVLEAKADSNKALASAQPQDVDMQNKDGENAADTQENVQNGDVEMKETTKENESLPAQGAQDTTPGSEVQTEQNIQEQKPEEPKSEVTQVTDKADKDLVEPVIADTRPDDTKAPDATLKPTTETQKAPESAEKKQSPKKTIKKRDKSKDKKDVAKENKKEEAATENKESKDSEKDVKKEVTDKNEVSEAVKSSEGTVDKEDKSLDNKDAKEEVMQVDANAKGDSNKADSQEMEVDGAASQ
ncbi:BAG domain-containing protein Samui isoform X1 [Vanessa cardui]|uniref:BAG domain-containing protein Samui isoform X1 n=1 Tax=Vanessa cardui TaxID=171605 RepID=UPI001F13E2EE|nr:BAG domain-containing protein Samui isoform X1 [Vanessa cardui]